MHWHRDGSQNLHIRHSFDAEFSPMKQRGHLIQFVAILAMKNLSEPKIQCTSEAFNLEVQLSILIVLLIPDSGAVSSFRFTEI